MDLDIILCTTLSNGDTMENNNSDIYQDIKHMFVNLIILEFSTKYYYSSTMSNGVGYSHKLVKQKRHQPEVTNGLLNTTASTFHGHDISNENIGVSIE